MSIRAFYDQWERYNRQMAAVIGAMSDEELAVRPHPDRWPVWATVGHTAAVRIYWLCTLLGEPGRERTPFAVSGATPWEDDLDNPRGADELVEALETTWDVVAACLDRWTAEDLAEPVEQQDGAKTYMHTRGSILQRLLTHDAYHCGELSQTLGVAGLPQIDIWDGTAPPD